MIISNESMDFNDPKELDDPQLFDDLQLFDDQLEVWTLMIQKSTVIPSSLMVLYVPKNGSTVVVEVVGPDLLFLCPGYLVHNIFLYNIYVGRRRWW